MENMWMTTTFMYLSIKDCLLSTILLLFWDRKLTSSKISLHEYYYNYNQIVLNGDIWWISNLTIKLLLKCVSLPSSKMLFTFFCTPGKRLIYSTFKWALRVLSRLVLSISIWFAANRSRFFLCLSICCACTWYPHICNFFNFQL
jgi:hypothetical protein